MSSRSLMIKTRNSAELPESHPSNDIVIDYIWVEPTGKDTVNVYTVSIYKTLYYHIDFWCEMKEFPADDEQLAADVEEYGLKPFDFYSAYLLEDPSLNTVTVFQNME